MNPPRPLRCRRLSVLLTLALVLPIAASRGAETLFWGSDGMGTTGAWTAAGVSWWNGAQAVAWTPGSNAVFQGAGGTVSSYVFGPEVASITFATAGYTLTGGWVNGGSDGLEVRTLADAVIASTLHDNKPFDANGLTKSGGGTLTVTGANFFDDVRVAEGEFVATGFSSAFFSDFGVETGATLTLAPSDSSSISVRSIAGGGLVRPDAQARTMTATFRGMDDFSGRIEDNGGGVLAVEYLGSSTGRLLSAAAYTGATSVTTGTLVLAAQGSIATSASLTISNDGRLRLDNLSAGASTSRLGASAPVKLERGGTLEITGSVDGVSQAAGSLSTAGSGNLVLTATAGKNAPAIQFSGFQRLAGSTLAIAGDGDVTLAGVANGATGIVTPAITMNNGWAVADEAGKLAAFTGYVGQFDGGVADDHVKLTAPGTTTAAGPLTRASLILGSEVSGQQLVLQGQLNLASGGLISAGENPATISEGILTAHSELIVTNANDLTISSRITNGGNSLALTKSGPGTLFLSGANTYTGVTTINDGAIAVGDSSALGGSSSIAFGGGALVARGDVTLGSNLAGVEGNMVHFDTNGRTIVSTGTISGALLKTGAGTLEMRQAKLGSVVVGQGLVRVTAATSGSVTLNEGTRLEAKGALSGVSLDGSATLSIGATNEVAKLTIQSFPTMSFGGDSVLLTIDFDIGSASRDSLVVTFPFSLGPVNPGSILFAFNNLGGLATGVNYQVMTFTTPGHTDSSGFALAPALVEAGWAARFTASSSGVTVNFSAVPEPGSLALLTFGLAGAGLAFFRKRRG